MVDKLVCFFKTLNERQVLLLLVGVSLGLRLYAVLAAQGIANDSAAYGFIARDFLKGHFIKGLSSPAPPFYPFLMFFFSPDSTHVEITGRLISVFFGTLTLIPLFYLVKAAVGQKEAIFSALLYTFHPYLVTYSGMLLTEATYWGLLVSSAYFFWTGLGKQVTWKIGFAGCLLGLAYLTRPEGIGYVLVYLVWVAVWGGVGKRWFKKTICIATLLLTVFVFVIPYVIYIHQETGQWLISKKAVEAQSQFVTEPIEKAHPSKTIQEDKTGKGRFWILRIAQNVTNNLPFVIYHYLRAYHFSLWLFLFFGLIRVRREGPAYDLFLGSLVLFHVFSLSTFIPSTIRFAVPVVPLSLFWAGAGIIEMKRYFEKIKGANAEKVIFLLVGVVILSQLPHSLKPERRHRAEQKKVALWLKQNTPPDAVIMSNSPQETFYAEREFIMFPSGISKRENRKQSYDKVMRYARAKGVGYILVNRNTDEAIPGFIDSIQPTDLKEMRAVGDRGTIIYEVIY